MPGPHKERPSGVTILGVLCICCGPVLVLAGLVWLVLSRNIFLIFVPFGAIPMLLGIGMGLIWATVMLVIGIVLLRAKRPSE